MTDRRTAVSSRATTVTSGAAESPITSGDPPPANMSNLRSTSPYGTRSRNRGARVNYAEDKDNEMDYEYTAPSVAASSTTKPSSTPQEGISGGSTRRQPGATATQDAKDAKVATTVIPSVPSNATAGKKRKGGNGFIVNMTKDPALSNMFSFDRPHLQNGKLVSDDGTEFNVHDHVYLVCEPPGEPYYLARIMEFLPPKDNPTQPIESIRVNWYYRPKDIHRKGNDTRIIFASMHSDTCPLTSIRGKCTIMHRTEIKDLDEYRRRRDSFYFERMFDRYIQRYYDVIPTSMVQNVPEGIRKVLVQRWKYLLVEPQRGKELCSQMKECKRCTGYCASTDSVHCAVCGSTYHMNCVRPPLLKKPTRGFGWACGPCNRAQERKLEARNTPTLTAGTTTNGEPEEDVFDDEEDDLSPGMGTGTATPSEAANIEKEQEPTPEQLRVAGMWQMRYLGQYCRIEDALDYDDRIYPRAGSRIGTRHQANVPAWPGRPIEYVKPLEKKKPQKGGNKAAKNTEAEAAKEKRPKWVTEEPPGYIERGKDNGSTSTLMFKLETGDEEAEREHLKILENYMASTHKIADKIGMRHFATNFVDKAVGILYENQYNEKKSLEQLSKLQPQRDLREPKFKSDEVKRFEEAVGKFGSELHAVTKHVKSRDQWEIVRFYYQWKKTAKGREIWGNYDGRKMKKEAKQKEKGGDITTTAPTSKLVDDVADNEDDSAFDVQKASDKKRGFQCKFCSTRHSRQWRRAPGVAPGTLISAEKSNSRRKSTEAVMLISALCRRCAELWRRYAIQWEDPDEALKKMNQGGGRSGKRRVDEDYLNELYAAQDDAIAENLALTASITPQPTGSGTETPDEKKEPPKKKAKTDTVRKRDRAKAKDSLDNETEKSKKDSEEKKKKEQERKEQEQLKEKQKIEEMEMELQKEQEQEREREREKEKAQELPPPPPEPPKPKLVLCGVCNVVEEADDQHVVCRDCKMSVHKRCYGVGEMRSANKWVCEMCTNDRNPTVSTNYECVLCPGQSDPDAEPEKNNPYHKSSYKKKVIQDRNNKESPEVDGRKIKDADKHKPQQPREPLKKTSGNNWAHVLCAIWTPEIKFSDPKTMRTVEGIGTIPSQRWQQECKICKGTKGSCVQCFVCHAYVHINCANKSGWTMGFDIQPIKGSRREIINTVKLGSEVGNMTACVWCPEHETKSTVHSINELCEETGKTVLEIYLETYKRADLTLTGTVRKANLVSISTKASQSNRRNSFANASGKEGFGLPSTVLIKTEQGCEDKIGGIEGLVHDHVGGDGPKSCMHCQIDVSPLWWKVPIPTNGVHGTDNLTNGHPQRLHTLGLLCHRCRNTEDLVLSFPPNSSNNRRGDGKYTPLPALHVFLAKQHAPSPAPVLPPPLQIESQQPPTVPQPSHPQIQDSPPIPSISQTLPPPSSHSTPFPVQQIASQIPQNSSMHTHGTASSPPQLLHPMAHPSVHQPPVHTVMVPSHHVHQPPHPQQISTSVSQLSHSPHHSHGSPPLHIIQSHVSPTHLPPQAQHIDHRRVHQWSRHVPSPPPPSSPEQPSIHMGSHMPHQMSPHNTHATPGLPRQNIGTQSHSIVQGSSLINHKDRQQQRPPQPKQEEPPRRILNGASGSPALANLLS